MIFTTAFGNIIRAEGVVKESMTGNLLSTVTNMLLYPLFILSLHIGVSGAAIATVLSNCVGVVYLLLPILRHSSVLTLSSRSCLKKPLGASTCFSHGSSEFYK